MPKLVEPEKWYFVVDCARCGEPIPFAKEKPHPRQRPIVDLRCPQCGHTSAYAPALMSVRQGPKRHDLA